MSIEEKLIEVAANVPKVYEAGKKQGVKEWWDDYLFWEENNSENRDFMYSFAGFCWQDSVYNPTQQINAISRSNDMFAYSNITNTKVAISIANSSTTNKNATFRNATKLVTINKFIINDIQTMNQQFTNCTKLKNLTIEGTIGKKFDAQWCPLSRASIENVVSCLSDTTSGLTCTFKASAVSNAFTDAEWEALTDTKPNWTFTTI